LCVQNKHIDDDEYGTCRMTWALLHLLLLLLLALYTTALNPVVAESEQTHNLIHPFGAAAAAAASVVSSLCYESLDLITVHLTLVSILDRVTVGTHTQ